MLEDSTILEVTPPKSIWFKPLKVEAKGLFKACTKALVHLGTLKFVDMIPDLADAGTAMGLKTTAGEWGWMLIQRALVLSLLELTSESRDELTDTTEKPLDGELDAALNASKLQLTPDFLKHPASLPIVTQVGDLYKQWLCAHGMADARAASVAGRLPSYFVYALYKEWRQHPSEYAPVQNALTTPVGSAVERELGRAYYRAWLMKQVKEGMFLEKFGLARVYVPLRGYYVEKERGSRDGVECEPTLASDNKDKKIVVDLRTELEAWRVGSDHDNALRVVSGGPGSGKSSCLKMYAADLAARGDCHVLFVPLHLLDISDNLVEAVGRFFATDRMLVDNPLDSQADYRDLLLIFDGLDELAMQGKASFEAAQAFLREVDRTLDRRNQQGWRLRAIVSGREIIIQANLTELRRPKHVLYVLPYFINAEVQKMYQDSTGLLKHDQRQAWWQKYGEAKHAGYKGLPQVLTGELDDVTAEPLLNYLVAISFERGQINYTASDLTQAVLLEANLIQANLGAAHLEGADFHRANLQGVNLQEVNLQGAILDGATGISNSLKKIK